MARSTTPLNDTQIKKAKPKTKKYKLYDGRGLFLLVSPQGGKLWRFKYRLHNKEREYAIGTYPSLSLVEARQKRDELKNLVANGIDPNQTKKESKQQAQAIEEQNQNSFEKISQEWIEFKRSQLEEVTINKHLSKLHKHIYPYFKEQFVGDIKAKEIIHFIKTKNREGVGFVTIKRSVSIINNVLRYSLNNGYIEVNVAASIITSEIIPKPQTVHRKAVINPKRVIEASLNYQGDISTIKALELIPYIFVRPSNISSLKWEHIDFEQRLIHIPREYMKISPNGDFIMPITHQVYRILKEMEDIKINAFVFPSFENQNASIHPETITKAYKNMNLGEDRITAHSWRSFFRTTVEEHQHIHGFSKSVMKALMHHKVADDSVEEAYNRATYDEPKRELIQWYADFIDENYR
ncbi:MAG: integrase arm-type DNA-binding domain-containing protein [Campylobacterota bacterium]|nr:integrase arm-type DNA-binding domain-containing protein [Campylobacterota bacterium]